MNYYILTGAGFSKNFGGWISSELWAFLIGHHKIQNNEILKELLWKNKNEGFENALYEAKENAASDERWNGNYSILQEVISAAFNEMNAFFLNQTQGQGIYHIQDLFKRFKVIFTTNQDTLVETQFHKLSLNFPGMKKNPQLAGSDSSKILFYPTGDFNMSGIPSTGSIYIKLHGSSNWRAKQNGNELMIMGGEKEEQIQNNSVIKSYFELFRESLSSPNSRLLILGHSLADIHINKIIFEAIKNNGLKFYIWNHSGLDSLMKKLIGTPGYDDKLFKKGFIGISNALLQDTLKKGNSPAFELEFDRIKREFFGE